MKTTPLNLPQHHCMQCRGPFHSAVRCGVLWSERDESTNLIKKVDCTLNAQSLWDSNTAAMCFVCVEQLNPNPSEPTSDDTRQKSRQNHAEVATRTNIPNNIIAVLSPTPTLPIDLLGPDDLEDAKPPAQLAPLKSVWDCERITKCMVGDVVGWNCGWCQRKFKPQHATRALAHVLKTKNMGIAVCTGHIPPSYYHRYSTMLSSKVDRKGAIKRSRERINDNIGKRQAMCLSGSSQASANASQFETIDVDAQSDLTSETGIRSRVNSPTRSPVSNLTWTSSKICPHTKLTCLLSQIRNQPSIEAALYSQGAQVGRHRDIRVCNDHLLEIAIADFFHCDNISDVAVESPRFLKVLKFARMTSNSFKVPNRNKIAGPLLRRNYHTTMAANRTLLLQNPNVWGISWMGDGATVKRMPFMNCLGMSGDSPPIVVGVSDCTEHMADGGKKDAPYIAQMYDEYVGKFDPTKMYTDIFFFDGASNVQKGGRILEAKYPRSYSLHATEHVVSLFFTDVAKLPPVKASTCVWKCIYSTHVLQTYHYLFRVKDSCSESL